MAYRITTETFRLSMTNGETHDFGTLERALEWSLEFHGIHSHYETDDGRWFLYASDEDNEADTQGGGELGAIERIVEEEELEPDYDMQATVFDDYYAI